MDVLRCIDKHVIRSGFFLKRVPKNTCVKGSLRRESLRTIRQVIDRPIPVHRELQCHRRQTSATCAPVFGHGCRRRCGSPLRTSRRLQDTIVLWSCLCRACHDRTFPSAWVYCCAVCSWTGWYSAASGTKCDGEYFLHCWELK